MWTTPRRLLALIVLIAAFLRFWRLSSFPVFIDEDIYAWSAHGMMGPDSAEAFRLTYAYWGKSPFPLWFQGLFGLVAGDALAAGRMIAAAAGCATTAMCFLLGRRVADSRVGLVAAALYATSPLAVLHERMGLLDGPMTACVLASLLLAWTAMERRSWPLAIAAFAAGAVAVQYKIPAMAVSAVVLLLLATCTEHLKARAAYVAVAAAGPVLSYAGLMLSPMREGLTMQNELLRVTPSFAIVSENLWTLFDSVTSYMPAGFWLLPLAGAVLIVRERPRTAIVFAAATGAWSLPWVVLSRFTPSRYYLPALPFLLVLAALAMLRVPDLIRRRHEEAGVAVAVLAALVAGWSAVSSSWLALAPATATLSKQDDWQYRSGWPSGYAYADAARYLATTAKAGSQVAYAIDMRHRVGAGLLHPVGDGVVSHGLVPLSKAGELASTPGIYVLVDDVEDDPPGKRMRSLLARAPGFRVLATFRRPGSESGTYVLQAGS